jgi:nucleoside-diphosphate-sugar epimerase
VTWHAQPGAARDFTYVDDVVSGTLAALRHGRPGWAYNLSGWKPVPVSDALALIAAGGREPRLRRVASSAVEAHVTHGCGRRAADDLRYEPRAGLAEGIRRQLAAASPGLLAA